MHHHCEIIMPNGFDIEQSIKEILAPFDENADDEDACTRNAFWDFYVIGGRFAGSKTQARLDSEKLSKFHERLTEMKITVSGLTAGKQELSPPSQIPAVDALWREMFPESRLSVCPLFKHSNDQYSSLSTIDGDITTLGSVPESIKADHVIFAARDYKNEKMEATFMVTEDMWNGCNHLKTEWDGTFKHALELFSKKITNMADQYIARATPKPDWLVVTVDYHY